MHKNRCGTVFIVICSFVLSFIVLEVAARSYLIHFASEATFNLYASYNQLRQRHGDPQYEEHRFIGYIPTRNYQSGTNQHNSEGFRGDSIEIDKPDGVYRIVCVGGSTTYSIGVPDYRLSYPYLLQEYLRQAGYENVEVINGGVSNYTSLESLISFQTRLIPLDPDLVIIYHGINDARARLVWPPSEFRGDYSGFRISPAQPPLLPSFLERSTAARLVGIRFGWLEPAQNLNRVLVRDAPTYYGELHRIQYRTETYPSGIFEEVSAMEMFEENSPEHFISNIRSIVSIAKANSVEPMVVTFSHSPEFQLQQYPRVASEEFQFAFEQQNQLLWELSQEMTTLFYDLEANMPDDVQFYVDGRHFTEAGNRTRSKLIGDYILQTGILEREP